ncbi:endonuclease IV [Elusimicrobium posterum]|uniref:TIM barrel protein n=1 Tax=Elusimicrobium posterum TaxID=3116653 RepID=UPI003C725C82
MRKLGLKVWSVNEAYVKPALELFQRGIYDYIEIFSVPDSFALFSKMWIDLKNEGVPFLIHGPHFSSGLNFALKDKKASNLALAAQAQKWADALGADQIIFHPGISGDITETARQLNILNDARVLIENKPYNIMLGPQYVCNGNNPAEIKYVLDNTTAGFCLDVGHAFCAANSLKEPKDKFLKEFTALNPALIHISDGDNDSVMDAHKHFGHGSYDFDMVFKILPKNIPISIETEKNSETDLNDFEADTTFVKRFL